MRSSVDDAWAPLAENFYTAASVLSSALLLSRDQFGSATCPSLGLVTGKHGPCGLQFSARRDWCKEIVRDIHGLSNQRLGASQLWAAAGGAIARKAETKSATKSLIRLTCEV